jgi:protein arginine kinase
MRRDSRSFSPRPSRLKTTKPRPVAGIALRPWKREARSVLDASLLNPVPFEGGSDRDVVLSCSVRLGRNLTDALFPNRASITEAHETRGRIMAAIGRIETGCIEVHLEELEAADSLLLAERGWADSSASSDPGRGLAILDRGATVLTVNEVDHLRIRSSVSGSGCEAAFTRSRGLDEALDAELGWAATPELGYLSARIEDGGSVLRASALVFIPGILAAGVLERVARGLLSSGIEPRLITEGHDVDTGEDPAGGAAFEPADLGSTTFGSAVFGPGAEGRTSPYVDLSSHAKRGTTEEDFLANFRSALSGLIDGERRTRDLLLASRRPELEDAAWRAASLLSGARLLSEGEARRLIADLRAGIAYGVAPTVSSPQSDPYAALDRARAVIGPGQLRVLARRGARPSPAPASLDAWRAELVRDVLPRYDIG